jgi:arylsulfatase A-like enzyme
MTGMRCLLVLFYLLCPALLASRPNRVWIIADDMSPDIAALGAKGGRTPNLDRLTSSALLFERVFVNSPSCGRDWTPG